MFIKSILSVLVVISASLAAPASAQDKPMKLESAVQLVRATEGGGQPQLVEAKNVVPGDTLVFTTMFRNQGGAAVDDFVIVNPLPAYVVLAAEPAGDASVSVDGGRVWGRLGELTIVDTNGEERAANIRDITHLRWEFAEVQSGMAGQVQFSAIVR